MDWIEERKNWGKELGEGDSWMKIEDLWGWMDADILFPIPMANEWSDGRGISRRKGKKNMEVKTSFGKD
jgi:hypothetical protein